MYCDCYSNDRIPYYSYRDINLIKDLKNQGQNFLAFVRYVSRSFICLFIMSNNK